MAKSWSYVGDINMLDYGGKFCRQLKGTRRFHFVELINMDEACGRDNEGNDRYVVELVEIDIDQMSGEKIKSAMDCCGITAKDEPNDRQLAEFLHSYGAKAHLESFEGNNGHKLLREAKALSWELEDDQEAFEEKMERPVNRLGSTAREYMKGDLDSAMIRGIEKGDPAARVVGQMTVPRINAVAASIPLTQGLSSSIPSKDPLAYMMGFLEGLADRDLPARKQDLAPAYLEGRKVAIEVRFGRQPVPLWAEKIKVM